MGRVEASLVPLIRRVRSMARPYGVTVVRSGNHVRSVAITDGTART